MSTPTGRDGEESAAGTAWEEAALQLGVMGVASWESGNLIAIQWLREQIIPPDDTMSQPSVRLDLIISLAL